MMARLSQRWLPVCLLVWLAGCAFAPIIRDPFADLDTSQASPSLKEMSVGLILSDNTLKTLEFVDQINSGRPDAYLKIPGMRPKVEDFKSFLRRTFKSVVELKEGADLQSVPVDLVAVLDIHFDAFGGVGSASKGDANEVAVGMKTIFLSRSRASVGSAYGKGITESFGNFGPQLRWQKNIEEALYRAANQMGKRILSSKDLAAFAKAAGAGEPAPAGPAPAAAVTSDVDELPASKARPNKSAYAMVIGIEQYRQKLPKADFAVHDAQTVTEYLTKVLGYPEENVVTLLNDRALKSDFEKYFEKWLGNHVEAGGTVFVYYSGHGAPDPKTGDAYLVPYDGDPSFIDQTGYPLKRMYAALGKLPAKRVVVALDSCFSGAGGRSVLAKGLRPLVTKVEDARPLSGNLSVMAAALGEQTSSTYDEKGHGLFTYFMLKGIKNEDVAKPDGSLELADLFAYLKPQVERVARKQFNNEQSPRLIETGGGPR
ncbi:MAG: caspase family protein [Elusimicrobia bacterium]|nr:caspase family protein [Elusimicrobiota bacterium]